MKNCNAIQINSDYTLLEMILAMEESINGCFEKHYNYLVDKEDDKITSSKKTLNNNLRNILHDKSIDYKEKIYKNELYIIFRNSEDLMKAVFILPSEAIIKMDFFS